MIEGLITTLFVGILLIILGTVNMTGNISSLHSYHRHRVSEENKKPFGKLVGLGTILCGVGTVILGLCNFVLEGSVFASAGTVIFCLFLAVGLGLNFYAMIKYNKGIF